MELSIQNEVEIINDKADIIASTMAGPLLIEPAAADITVGPSILDVTVDLKDEGGGVNWACTLFTMTILRLNFSVCIFRGLREMNSWEPIPVK